MGEPRLPSLLVAHHRPGFYLRVLTEGHVSAGDEIVRTARGPHALSVAEVDALLYLPGHDVEQLKAALDIPALSPGWRESFRSMVEGERASAGRRRGRATAGLGGVPHPHRHRGRRRERLRDVVPVRRRTRRCRRTCPASSSPCACPSAGDPVPVRTYSLSGDPDGGAYRISVKGESLGLVSAYLHTHLQHGDRIEVAAPRGDFVLAEGSEPVLLVSAGIGLTPLLAMLHRLATSPARAWCGGSTRPTTRTAMPWPPRQPTCWVACRRRTRWSTTRLRHSRPRRTRASGRATDRGGDRGPGPADGRERLCLRPGVVHERRHRRARGRRHRPERDPHRAVRVAVADQPRRRRGGGAARRTSRPARRGPARR